MNDSSAHWSTINDRPAATPSVDTSTSNDSTYSSPTESYSIPTSYNSDDGGGTVGPYNGSSTPNSYESSESAYEAAEAARRAAAEAEYAEIQEDIAALEDNRETVQNEFLYYIQPNGEPIGNGVYGDYPAGIPGSSFGASSDQYAAAAAAVKGDIDATTALMDRIDKFNSQYGDLNVDGGSLGTSVSSYSEHVDAATNLYNDLEAQGARLVEIEQENANSFNLDMPGFGTEGHGSIVKEPNNIGIPASVKDDSHIFDLLAATNGAQVETFEDKSKRITIGDTQYNFDTDGQTLLSTVVKNENSAFTEYTITAEENSGLSDSNVRVYAEDGSKTVNFADGMQYNYDAEGNVLTALIHNPDGTLEILYADPERSGLEPGIYTDATPETIAAFEAAGVEGISYGKDGVYYANGAKIDVSGGKVHVSFPQRYKLDDNGNIIDPVKITDGNLTGLWMNGWDKDMYDKYGSDEATKARKEQERATGIEDPNQNLYWHMSAYDNSNSIQEGGCSGMATASVLATINGGVVLQDENGEVVTDDNGNPVEISPVDIIARYGSSSNTGEFIKYACDMYGFDYSGTVPFSDNDNEYLINVLENGGGAVKAIDGDENTQFLRTDGVKPGIHYIGIDDYKEVDGEAWFYVTDPYQKNPDNIGNWYSENSVEWNNIKNSKGQNFMVAPKGKTVDEISGYSPLI